MTKRLLIIVLVLGFAVCIIGFTLNKSVKQFFHISSSQDISKSENSSVNTFEQASPSDNSFIVNGNIPESAKYIGALDAVTPIKVDVKDLTTKIEKKLGRKPKILISSLHMTNDWNRLVSQSAINAGKEADAEVIVTNAQGNWNKQISDIEDSISSKVDAIVIAGGISKSLQEVIKKASEAKIPVTTVDIPSPYVLTNVTSDNYSGGAILAMKMALDMKGKGNIAVIYSPGWHSIEIRRFMLSEVLREWPGIKIVTEQPVDEEDAVSGTMNTMKRILEKFPEKGSLNAVFTGFGLAGVGAARAVEAAGRSSEIPVYTVDADIVVLKDILKKDGAIKACIGQTTNQMGRTATIAALKGIIGETEGIGLQTFCPITSITKDNANQVGKYLYGDEWQ